MAVFNYKVVDRDGKNKKGTIEAPNRDGAEKKLKSEGYSIMSLTEQSSPLGGIGFKKKVKSRDLGVFCKQFSAVIKAGVTIISALELMGDQIENTEKGHSRCAYICRERWNSGGCAQS